MSNAIAVVDAPTQPDDLAALQRTLNDVNAKLEDPAFDGDVDTLLRQRDETAQRIKIAQARADHARNVAFRAGLATRREAFLADLKEPLERLTAILPELHYRL